MKEDTKVPEPEDSGSDGTQTQANTSQSLVTSQSLMYPIAEAITGLASSNSRVFGGEVASTLIAGAASQMATELAQTKQELAKLREKNDTLTTDLSEERTQKAIYKERIDNYSTTRHLKNIGIAVGTLLIGVGIQLIRNNFEAYGLASIIVGALLLVVGWISVPKGGDK